MEILWISWKDKKNPLAGGAEVVTDQLLSRLASDGHQVTLLTSNFPGGESTDERNGYSITRVGSRLKVYHAARSYLRRLTASGKRFDLVVEEVNTLPFFARKHVKADKYFLFFHQLARQVWWYEMPFPLSAAGYFLEPLYLRSLHSLPVITVSESTKQDLVSHGFPEGHISIISEGILLQPLPSLESVEKYDQPTVLSLGALRAMKRTLDQVKAFEIAKERSPELRMVIAGPTHSKYGEKVTKYIASSRYKDSIELLGSVSEEKKRELMQRSHAILVTSIKEGWGLIVTEANSQGTPAVVYNVDGLRDSVRDGQTGVISRENTPASLADALVGLLEDKTRYQTLRKNAWQWSREITFDRCYKDFLRSVGWT